MFDNAAHIYINPPSNTGDEGSPINDKSSKMFLQNKIPPKANLKQQ